MKNEKIIEAITRLSALKKQMNRKFGTESYIERCELHDIKELLSQANSVDIKISNIPNKDICRLYAAFCGTGKTFICEKTNVKAVEIEYWKYKDKGLQKEYIEDVKKYYNSVDYIFIATDPEGLKLLHNEGFDITLVYPKNELRNEYLDRYVERDSPHDFIGVFMKYWHPWINELKEQSYCNHIVLESGQYLQDVI